MARTKQHARMINKNKGKPPNWDINVNGGKIIKCNKEVLKSLSPTIAKFLEDNPSSASYDINLSVEPTSVEAWNNISDYLLGKSIHLNIIDFPFYLETSKKLGLESFIQFLEEVNSDVKSSCDHAIKNYDHENPFMIELELLEQNIFQLNINNFQAAIDFILDFLNDENDNIRFRFFSELIYQFCITRTSQDDYNLGLDLLNEIYHRKNQVKIELIKYLNKSITKEIKIQYFTRTLYEKKILTNEEMKLIINLFKLEEKYKNNFAYLHSNLVFLLDFIITEISENQLKFSNQKIWNNIGTPNKQYQAIKCEINPDEKEGYFGLNCFSVNSEDTEINNYKLSELMKNNWELHKKLCKGGNNESEIACLIRNDDIDNFISLISKESKFDINKKIPFSIYEKESILQDCTLIQYAAYYSSIKIFKYLIVQKAEIKKSIFNFAFVGGNLEIIHICDEIDFTKKNVSNRPLAFTLFTNDRLMLYDMAIKYHRHDILQWLIETKKIIHKPTIIINFVMPPLYMEDNSNLIRLCLDNCNFISLHYLLTQEFYFPQLLADSINAGLTCLTKFVVNLKYLPKDDSKLNGEAFYKACSSNNIECLKLFIEDKNILPYQKVKRFSEALNLACSKNYAEIVKLILMNLPEIDVNEKNSFDESPLYVACKEGYTEIVKLLIDYRKNDLEFNDFHHHGEILTLFFF